MIESQTTNRLANETSPYLLQHAHNPVDWYPWGEEAFARARAEDKPVFLSIGYSACHWCHVMERESFEDAETAATLNEHFVSIKVDREERPEVDSIYMQAVQMMTGHGGWPMSVFLTPAGEPFFGGTYFPPQDRHGMPAFRRVLHHVHSIYHTRRDDVMAAAREIRGHLDVALERAGGPVALERGTLRATALHLEEAFDPVHGGFGSAPKFPPAMTLDFLLRIAVREEAKELEPVITTTLDAMAHGGIYDHVGGGFHRYSTDARWLVPHFEKMLYDQALLARMYVEAWRWSKDPLYARVANETLGFVAREMLSPAGGFYSTLDADSEGVEGKFYVWSRAEVLEVLGAHDGPIFCTLYDITEHGNWEGANILNMTRPLEQAAAEIGMTTTELADFAARGKCKLYGRRASRVRPGLDDKVLAGWNGWMLGAFAEGALAFGSDAWMGVVRGCADFLIREMLDGTRLYRSWKNGERKIPGLLEDYAGVAWGLILAFEATQERRYLDTAKTLAHEIRTRFIDDSDGTFFETASDHERLITRPKDLFDNATPGGNSVAIDTLLRLGAYFGDETYDAAARRALDAILPLALRYPSGMGFLLGTAVWASGTPLEIAITGPAGDAAKEALVRKAATTWMPLRTLVTSDCDLPVLEGREPSRVAAYVCEGTRCLLPTADASELEGMIVERRRD